MVQVELLWELGVELHRQHTGKIAIVSGRESEKESWGFVPVFPWFCESGDERSF